MNFSIEWNSAEIYAKYVNLSLIHALSRSGQTSLVFLVNGKTLKTLSHECIAIQIVIFENPVKPGQKDKRICSDYSQPDLLISYC